MELRRAVNGALAGAGAAGVWALQQPLDRRAFRCSFDDVELLGRWVTRGAGWRRAGLALHLQNGAGFGVLYAVMRSRLPGPGPMSGALAAMVEHAATWPLVGIVDRVHPARRRFPTLAGNRRALAQATWRHMVFGVVLGLLEARLNRPRSGESQALSA